MAMMHRQMRQRTKSFTLLEPPRIRQQTRVSEAALLAAQIRYEAGTTLSEIAAGLDVSRQRLAALLRTRGVPLRRRQPEGVEVEEMVCSYARGDSLDRIGSRLGFAAGTVRRHLVARGVAMRDRHGRER